MKTIANLFLAIGLLLLASCRYEIRSNPLPSSISKQ